MGWLPSPTKCAQTPRSRRVIDWRSCRSAAYQARSRATLLLRASARSTRQMAKSRTSCW